MLVFSLAIVSKVLRHCHSWLARQYYYDMRHEDGRTVCVFQETLCKA